MLFTTAAFAAFNDVNLTSSTVISAAGFTLNVSGSNAVIESIVVGPSNFTLGLQSGSTATIKSTGAVGFTLSPATGSFTSTNTTCSSSGSTLVLTASGPISLIVTPVTCIVAATQALGSTHQRPGEINYKEPVTPAPVAVPKAPVTSAPVVIPKAQVKPAPVVVPKAQVKPAAAPKSSTETNSNSKVRGIPAPTTKAQVTPAPASKVKTAPVTKPKEKVAPAPKVKTAPAAKPKEKVAPAPTPTIPNRN